MYPVGKVTRLKNYFEELLNSEVLERPVPAWMYQTTLYRYAIYAIDFFAAELTI